MGKKDQTLRKKKKREDDSDDMMDKKDHSKKKKREDESDYVMGKKDQTLRKKRKRELQDDSDDTELTSDDCIPPTPRCKKPRLKVMMFKGKLKGKNKKGPKKQRERKLIPCQECAVPQKNIWRHMRNMHSSTISTAKSSKAIRTKKGYIIYICPARHPKNRNYFCNKVVTRLREHLVKFHKIENGSTQLRRLMNKAEPLERLSESEEELTEEESDQEKSHPPKVKIEQSHIITDSDVDQLAPTQPQPVKSNTDETDLMNTLATKFIKFLQASGQSNLIKQFEGVKKEPEVFESLDIKKEPDSDIIIVSSDTDTEANTTQVKQPLRKHLQQIYTAVKYVPEVQQDKKKQHSRDFSPIDKDIEIKESAETLEQKPPQKPIVEIFEEEDLFLEEETMDNGNSPPTDKYVPEVQQDKKKQHSSDFSPIDKDIEIKESAETLEQKPPQKPIVEIFEEEDLFLEEETMDNGNSLPTDKYVPEVQQDKKKQHSSDFSPIDKDIEIKESAETLEQKPPQKPIVEIFEEEDLPLEQIKKYKQMTKSFDRNNINKDPLAESFSRWLRDIPFLMPYKSASQHVNQAFTIWYAVAPNRTVAEFIQKEALNGWFISSSETMAPGTMTSYIGSLLKLFDFLIDTSFVKEKEEARTRRCMDHIRQLRKLLCKKKRERQSVVQTEQIQTMLAPDDISDFLESDIVKKIKEISKSPKVPTQPEEYYYIRDFLLLKIIQTNASRPGAVKSLTHKSIDRAKMTEDGWATTIVAEHKTTASRGPATLAFNPEVYKMLKVFISMIREIPGYQIYPNQPLFTTHPKPDGSIVPLNSSEINNAINRLWAEGPVKKTISSTKIRKATTTLVRRADPGMRESLAHHMKHDPRTADKFYELFESQETAANVGKKIARVMENLSVRKSIHWPKSPKDEEKDMDTKSHSDMEQVNASQDNKSIDSDTKKKSLDEEKDTNTTGQSDKEQVSASQDNKSIDSDTTEDYDINEDLRPASPLYLNELAESGDQQDDSNVENETSLKQEHKRRSFEPEEAAQLIHICGNILQKDNVKKASVMRTLTESEEGRSFVLKLKDRFKGKDFWKCVTDRVHVERKRRNRLSQ